MSELAYVHSYKKEFYNVNVRNLSHEDIRRLHKEMFARQSYHIKRENLVVFCAIACRAALNLKINIFVRFVDTEVVSFLEETGIINLVLKSNFSNLSDTFVVSSPHSKIINELDSIRSNNSSYESSSRFFETDSRIRYQPSKEDIPQRMIERSSEYNYQKDNSILLDKINDLEKECNRLFSLSQEKESTITRLSSELESKTKEYNSLFSSFEKLKEKSSDLSTAVDYITEEKNRADTEIMRLRNIILQIEQHAAQLQMKINRLEKMSNGNLSTINELTKQLDSMHQLYSSTSAQLTTLQKKSTEFINRADQKEEENSRLLAEIALLKEENVFLLRKYKGEDTSGEDSTPKKRKLSNAGQSDN